MKTCKMCLINFVPDRPMQVVCSPLCGAKYVTARRKAKQDKDFKKETIVRRKAAKSKTEWLNDLQVIVNRYVRLRDSKLGCCSCHKHSQWKGQWHCSHFYPRSTSSAVRFHLWNLHKSCSTCNGVLSGNLTSYRPRLIAKIGQERYDWLESNHNNIADYDIEWIQRAIKVARKGVKRMEKRV